MADPHVFSALREKFARLKGEARKLSVNLTLGEITSDIDPAGNSDPVHHTTTYAYNALGQLTGKILPEGDSGRIGE